MPPEPEIATQRHRPMKLYGDLVSPYVRMCLVTAYEAGLGEAVELVQTGVEVASVNAALEALSPIAQIPVLAGEDGLVLHDSRVIVDYLCSLGRERALIPGGGKERFRVLTLQAIAQGIADSAVAYRNETHQRPPTLHWHALLARWKHRVGAALDALETRWPAELATVNVGSISAAVVLSYLDFRFSAWSWRAGRGELAAFHDRFCTRASMRATALPAS